MTPRQKDAIRWLETVGEANKFAVHHHMTEPTPATTGDQTTEQVRDFVAWLVEHDGGRTATAASLALADVARAVDDHQRPGTVTLRITMKPAAPAAVQREQHPFVVRAPQAPFEPGEVRVLEHLHHLPALTLRQGAAIRRLPGGGRRRAIPVAGQPRVDHDSQGVPPMTGAIQHHGGAHDAARHMDDTDPGYVAAWTAAMWDRLERNDRALDRSEAQHILRVRAQHSAAQQRHVRTAAGW